MTWMLLIYTIPSEPTRKRAHIWRELKKVGAMYLRDGVSALPQRPETVAAFEAIAAKIEEFGGEATLVADALLAEKRAEALIAASCTARTGEYADLAGEAEAFLVHVQRETAHRGFTFTEVEELERDLAKLTRWMEQVRTRDYFCNEAADGVTKVLKRCEDAVALFLEAIAREDKPHP